MQALPTAVCRHCQQPLDALARLRGLDICGAATCRQRNDQLRQQQQLRDAADAVVRQLAASQPALQARPPAVVWLHAHAHRVVDTTEAQRAEHQAQLQAAAEQQLDLRRTHRNAEKRALADAAATALDQAAPQAWQLCAQCQGRCCQHGAACHAFIDWQMLQRVQGDNPGSSIADVIARYVALLPDSHIAHACLYQTADGCSLPRALRSDTCNDFACDALLALRQANATAPRAVVALTLDRGAVTATRLMTPLPT